MARADSEADWQAFEEKRLKLKARRAREQKRREGLRPDVLDQDAVPPDLLDFKMMYAGLGYQARRGDKGKAVLGKQARLVVETGGQQGDPTSSFLVHAALSRMEMRWQHGDPTAWLSLDAERSRMETRWVEVPTPCKCLGCDRQCSVVELTSECNYTDEGDIFCSECWDVYGASGAEEG